MNLRPLLRSAGRTRLWRPGESMAGVPTVRVWLRDGALGRIPLDENGEVTLGLADGSKIAIPVCGVFNGR